MTRIIQSLLIVFLFILNSNLFSGWTVLNSGTTVNLLDVSFINENTGWADGFQQIPVQIALLKTTNGGVNWISQSGNGPTSRLQTLYFINSNTGWVMGTDAGLYITTNGGTNYTLQSAVPGFWSDCFFLNVNTGWASGLEGTKEILVKTTNNGLNWITQTSNVNPVFTSIFFTDVNTGYGTVNNGSIYKTTNGGAIWTNIYSPIESPLNSVMFTSSSTGYAVGGMFYKTTDSGNNWVRQYPESGTIFNSVYFIDANTGYSCGSAGKIIKTTNGGANWYLQVSNTSQSLSEIQFVNANTGYAVGSGGTILKTTDGGGMIGINKISNEVPVSYELYQNYPNPFNPSTIIKFSIPSIGQRHAFDLQIIIYDILGGEVSTLVNEQLSPGIYEVDFDGSEYASGIYYYNLRAGDFTVTKKMILIK